MIEGNPYSAIEQMENVIYNLEKGQAVVLEKDIEDFERAAFSVIDYVTFWEDLSKKEQDKINKERDA